MNRETKLEHKKERGINVWQISLTLLWNRLIPFLSIAIFILFWWLLTLGDLINPLLLPGPVKVFASFVTLLGDGTLVKDTGISLLRVIQGFIIATLIALPIGMIMGMSKHVYKFIDPLVEIIRPIPPIAFIPLAILWFGIGELSKIFIIMYGAFFPILINTISGFNSVDQIHIRAAQALGANRLQVFRDVTLRSAFPDIIVGLRLGVGMAFIVLVAAELIASDAGLGYLIQNGRAHFKTEQVIVGMCMIGVLGFFLNKGLIELEKRIVKWRHH